MSDKFANLTRDEIARKFIAREQRDLLEEFFGKGVDGAKERLKSFYIPNDLTLETLEAYGEIATRTIAEKLDKSGAQVLRLELVEKALDEIGD